MKTPDAIKAVISAMCSAVNIPFVRAEQDGPRPKGIFLSYKLISQEKEPCWQNSQEITSDPDKPDVAMINTILKSSVTVSFTILGQSASYGAVWDKCIACLSWLDSEDAMNLFKSQRVIPKFVPFTVQDRSAYLETGFETRLGFDVVFSGVTIQTTNVDAVDIEETINSLPEV